MPKKIKCIYCNDDTELKRGGVPLCNECHVRIFRSNHPNHKEFPNTGICELCNKRFDLKNKCPCMTKKFKFRIPMSNKSKKFGCGCPICLIGMFFIKLKNTLLKIAKIKLC